MKKLFDQKFYETFLSEFKDLNSEYASIIERGRKHISTLIRQEIEKNNFEDECWLEALAESEGDEKKAKGKYIKLRFDDLLKNFEINFKIYKLGIQNREEIENFEK